MERRTDIIEEFFRSLKGRKQLEECDFEGLKYYRLRDDTRAFLRGTVYYEGELIVGYPRIGRILSLEGGIRSNIQSPFWVEEKADGYNVRIAKLGDRIVALTRSGYVCPFTTDRLMDLADFERFFHYHPDLVIAGEVVGRNTPYTELYPSYIDAELAFFAFDIFSKNDWHFVTPEERYKLFEEFDIPQVEHWGPFDYEDMEYVKDILRWLDSRNFEGVVIKSYTSKRVKYVLPHINIRDVEFSSNLILELPPEFFTQRIVRIVLSSFELGIPLSDEDYSALGRAFCEPLKDMLNHYLNNRKVSLTYQLKFRNIERAYLLVDSINSVSKTVRAKLVDYEKEGDYYIVRLEKTFLRSTGILGNIIKGGLFFD